MGKIAKSSRKGKKAWRANISTEDIHDFFEKSTNDALSGGSLASLPSDSLFFLDKSIGFPTFLAHQCASSNLSVKRKIEKHMEKVLHCDSILQKNKFVQPVPSSMRKKSKNKCKEVPKAQKISQDVQKDDKVLSSEMADLWDEIGDNGKKEQKPRKPSIIPAVEVEPAGCSFNPSFESHQDSLAYAVADEMQKLYRNELGPKPVPVIVPSNSIDDEEESQKALMDFIKKDYANDNEDIEDLDENEGTPTDLRASKRKRVTRVEHNKRAKRKEILKEEAKAKKVKNLSKQINKLHDIVQEIVIEDDEKHKRHLRRLVVKQERSKVAPPRMGKHKFQPAPVQVLLSEDITGSLRKLKGCCTLARDRFKSLEKRGIIVPTAKTSRSVELSSPSLLTYL